MIEESLIARAAAAYEATREVREMEAQRAAALRLETERAVFADLLQTILGATFPKARHTPDLRVEGVDFMLGTDRRGYACLRAALACPRCGRSYGDWEVASLADLGEALAREHVHWCAEAGATARTRGLGPPRPADATP